MKSFALTSALLAAAVSANPTPTEQEPPSKRASLPTVTASGNGKATQFLNYTWLFANIFLKQPSGPVRTASTSAVSIISPVDLPTWLTRWLIPTPASVTSPSSRSWESTQSVFILLTTLPTTTTA